MPCALAGRTASTKPPLLTARELERDDPRPPRAEHEIAAEVLLRVPERAVVARIDREVAVVAPTSLDLRLRARARPRNLLGLRHLTERIAGRASRVPDGRVIVRPRRAEADRDVAGVVHRDAAHPAPERVRVRVARCVRPLLVDRGGAVFLPAPPATTGSRGAPPPRPRGE